MNTDGKKEHILIVDDDPGICRTMELIFKAKEYDATIAHTGSEVIDLVKTTKFNLAILDIVLPDMKGMDLLSLLNEEYPEIDIIMITGHASTETAIQAINLGAIAYITKPIDMDAVLRTVALALERRRMMDEKNRAEEALRESEEKFRLLAENMQDGLWMRSIEENQLIFVNRALLKVYGRSEKEMLAKSDDWKLWIYEDDRDRVISHHEALLANGTDYSDEWCVVRPKGEVRWISSKASLITDNLGNPARIVGIERDITEQKQMEVSLKQSEMWFRSIFRESPIAINVFDTEGILLAANKACVEFAGVKDVSELENFNILDDPNLTDDYKMKLKNGEKILFESSVDFSKVKEQGLYPTSRTGVAYVESAISPLIVGEGEEHFGFLVQLIETTDRKLAEENITKERDKAQLYLDIADVMFVALNSKGQITMLNKRACEILECTPEDVIGKNWFTTFIPERIRKVVRKAFTKLIDGETESIDTFENPVISLSGKERLIAWHNVALYDSEGMMNGVLSSGEDITEARRAEEGLHRELEINRAVAYLSNTLNDPQTNVEKISSIVLEYSKVLTKSKHGYVSTIDSETKENILLAQTKMVEIEKDRPNSTVRFKADKKGRYPGLWGHSLNTQTAFFTNSPAAHESSKRGPKKQVKLNNFLSVPAMVADRVIGQISMADSERDYDKQDIEAVLRLARLFALAVVKLRDQEQLRYHAELLDDVSDAVISTDLESRVRSWNKAAEDIYGWSFNEVAGKPISEILQTEYSNDSAAEARKTLEDSGRWSGEVLQFRKDGTVLPILSSVSLVVNTNLNTVGKVSVNKDMTEQRKAKTQVLYERDRAMLYLDLMGHDIRNKLQTIVMGVDIFSEIVDKDEDEITPILDDVINAAEKIRSLIIKVKKTEQLTGVPLSETSIVNVLNDTMKEFSLKYKKVEINVSMIDSNPTIMADEFIDDMLHTFLENAVEHNTRKRKRVWVSLEMDSGGILISIGDNGLGIPDDRKDELFDKTRRFGGVGLHQAKQIIDKYQGRIEVANRVPKDIQSGTVIKIWIPKGNRLNGSRSENNVLDRNAAKISAK